MLGNKKGVKRFTDKKTHGFLVKKGFTKMLCRTERVGGTIISKSYHKFREFSEVRRRSGRK